MKFSEQLVSFAHRDYFYSFPVLSSLSQIEQFTAQLYSDVDYVIYPMKDPALSRQEYMDAKQGQVRQLGQL